MAELDKELLISELNFKAVRSSGSGGQHVNKVASKVILSFDLANSRAFTSEEKERLLERLKHKLSNENSIVLQCDRTRSQHKNKEIVRERFIEMITKGLKVKKKRIQTKIPKSVTKKRLESKRKHSAKKDQRKKPEIE